MLTIRWTGLVVIGAFALLVLAGCVALVIQEEGEGQYGWRNVEPGHLAAVGIGALAALGMGILGAARIRPWLLVAGVLLATGSALGLGAIIGGS